MMKASLFHICKLQPNSLTWGIRLQLPLIYNSEKPPWQQVLTESTDFGFEVLKKKKIQLYLCFQESVVAVHILFFPCYVLKSNTGLSFSMKTFQTYL